MGVGDDRLGMTRAGRRPPGEATAAAVSGVTDEDERQRPTPLERVQRHCTSTRRSGRAAVLVMHGRGRSASSHADRFLLAEQPVADRRSR